MKLLNCVLSYNRYYYLRNTVESLLEYFRFGDTLVVDDGSSDPRLTAYLADLARRGIAVARREREPGAAQAKHGGLYANMDLGVERAAAGGYDYVQFIQDDVQFLWHDPAVLEKTERIFRALSDCSLVENIFFNAIVRGVVEKRVELVPEANCYHRRPHGMLDQGIAPVSLIQRMGFRFASGNEGANSKWWRQRGYRTYRLHSPSMAFVPWPATLRHSQQASEGLAPPERYYLKPLTDVQVRRLTDRPLSELPFAEDYCEPWGWTCPKPYWYGPDLRGYEHSLHRIRHGWLRRLRALGRAALPPFLRRRIKGLVGK